ncbi:MAG: adenylosuccinate lyase family protein, partial [Saprospiraceae bacterium]|nr:adenylosuccinate lyase family protein [Saprospiraceae bacterium]
MMFEHLFYTDYTTQLCSTESMVKLMMEVELALAKAQEDNKLIPKGTAGKLEGVFQILELEPEKLKANIPLSGNASAPLVKLLVQKIKEENAEAAKYIHLGATSQDIVDTATILKAKHFLAWLHEKLDILEKILVQLTLQHRQTIMIGRTLMQHARPITFGLKTANWLQGLISARQYLHHVEDPLLCIQLGGAVGSRNQYLTSDVRHSFANNLGLNNVPPWHTQRVNIAAFAAALGQLSASVGKIAKDVVMLSQVEVGEVFEPAAEGRGTSSTMPHKRNPVLSAAILSNIHRIPFLVATILASVPQEHERSAGLWQAEWETLDDILGLTAGVVEKAINLLDGLEINENRMVENIEVTKGLVFAEGVALALASKTGVQSARELVKQGCQQAAREGRHLREVLEEMDLNFSKDELDQLFDPGNSIGYSVELIDEILAA